MRRLLDYASAIIGAIIGGALMGLLLPALLPTPPTVTAPRAYIAALPGIGPGWIDTLERVAGRGPLDTINPREMKVDNSGGLIGLYEWTHDLVSVYPRMLGYAHYASYWNPPRCEYQRHPIEVTGTPAGTLAHEFGHRFQYRLFFGEDTTRLSSPAWAANEIDERFADRFARAMLALRGWVDPDSTDAVLNHRVRYLLLRSYWPKEEQR